MRNVTTSPESGRPSTSNWPLAKPMRLISQTNTDGDKRENCIRPSGSTEKPSATSASTVAMWIFSSGLPPAPA
ncbi:MAG: hypothetical protein IR164_06145 [Devosia sp.]|nr:hypothetical protein [Devosia sp.]MBF0678499.1 hypothetical protein [Devosia sp.]